MSFYRVCVLYYCFISELMVDGRFPKTEDLCTKLGKGRANKKLYTIFATKILPLAEGKTQWKNSSKGQGFTKFVTPSTEAFALLCIKNNITRVCYLVENENTDEYKKLSKDEKRLKLPGTAYTAEGGNAKKIGGGWKDHALDDFIKVHETVVKDRKKLGKKFDVHIKKIINGVTVQKKRSFEDMVKAETRKQVPEDFSSDEEQGDKKDDDDDDSDDDDDDDEDDDEDDNDNKDGGSNSTSNDDGDNKSSDGGDNKSSGNDNMVVEDTSDNNDAAVVEGVTQSFEA